MNARIEVNDHAVMAWIGALVARGIHPPMREMGHTLAENTRLRFRAGRAPSGAPWAPLSPVTIARRRGGSSAPLMDTGRLRNSVTFVLDGPSAVVVGTNVVYGRMQHFGAAKGAFGTMRNGAPIPWGRVPGRPYLGVSLQDRGDLLDVLRAAYAKAA